MKKKILSANDYQKLCSRTSGMSDGFDMRMKEIMTWGLGIAGEAGDVAGCIKKTCSHGSGNEAHIAGIRETLGDTMWYIAAICNFYKWDLSDIMGENIEKLAKRYPKGHFTIEHAARGGKRVDWNEK